MSAIRVVFFKELLETVRDRRTLAVMILLPLALYPLVGIGFSELIATQRQQADQQVSRVGLAGPEWHELRRFLLDQPLLGISDGANAEAIRQGRIDAVLQLPRRPEGETERPLTIELLFNASLDRSLIARDRLRDALKAFSKRLAEQRLAARRLPATLLRPLAVADRDLATKRARGQRLIAVITPTLVVLMVLIGAFYPAIDLTAGEKERGTLETLLAAPVPRLSLVLGKFLVVSTVATLTGLFNLLSLGLTVALGFGPAFAKAGVGLPSAWSFLAVAAALIPTAMFFSSLMIAVAAVARSFKEAQTFLTPVYLVCVVPALVAQVPGVELGWGTALLPALNIALLCRELISGQVVLGPALLAALSATGYALIALLIAARIYNSERLLFGGRRTRLANGRQLAPEPSQAGLLLLLVMAGIIFVGQAFVARSVIVGSLVNQWLLIALPTLLLIKYARLDPRTVLSLRPASSRALFGAMLAASGAWYLVSVLVEQLQQRLMPLPPEVLRQLENLLVDRQRPFALDVLALAISPAICEELLFRGVILSASRQALSTRSAVLLNGVLFGLFHMSAYRFFPTMLLGMLLALFVVRSGSILPAMLFHLLNNAITLAVARIYGSKTAFGLLVFSLTSAAVLLGLFFGLRRRSIGAAPAPEET
ncbi:MAG: CPBP family intramembrane metalloprotease [Deltaproteobacteria bacterium]|nr:CPBP family intramembrane metalloprotease [Deltaproteobacteria bacterium]